MVKHILSTVLFSLASSLIFGQLLSIRTPSGTQDLNGETIELEISSTNTIYVDLNVKNISGSTINSIAARKIINGNSSWTDEVCYGDGVSGGCYPLTSGDWVMPSGDYLTLNDNQIGIANLKIHPNTPNNAIYRYYFGTTNNPYEDSVDVKITNSLSLKDVKKVASISVAPNPANEYLSVKASGVENATLKVVDVLGNVIMVDSFNGSKSINTSSFKNGVYFVIISGEGSGNINRKIVVRH